MQNTIAAAPHACRINTPADRRIMSTLRHRSPEVRSAMLRFIELRAFLVMADQDLASEIKRQADALLDAAQSKLDRIEAAKIAAEQKEDALYV